MSDWKNFNIDVWWKAVLVLGILAVAASLMFEIDFIERKHLFGFGLGMIFVGIAQWMAWKNVSQFVAGGILSTKAIKHSPVSVIILVVGICFICLFGFLIIKGLI